MGSESTVGLTWADLQRFPEDGKRREIIDGVLHVTPSPFTQHQRVVGRIYRAFADLLEPLGGEAFGSPLDVIFDQFNVVEPDVLVIAPGRPRLPGDQHVHVVPDVAVEVSSRSTKGVDRIKKRALYERFGVPEYWIVDLDHDVIEIYRLDDGAYGPPTRFTRGDTVTSSVVAGLAAPFERLVPPA